MAAAETARWTWIWPALAWMILVIAPLLGGGGFVYAAAGVALFGTVFAAVYHAEVIAHRVGEPFGTLILALAVTVIETALIVSVMIAAPAEKAGLARDTVFAAVMIVCNGIVGACLLAGGVRHHEQGFQTQGASAALAVLVALTGLTMVLPNLAAQELGPLYNKPQLVFAGLVSLVLYFAFVFVQTVRHRDYFLPDKGVEPGGTFTSSGQQNDRPERRSSRRIARSRRWSGEGFDAFDGTRNRLSRSAKSGGGDHHRCAGSSA